MQLPSLKKGTWYRFGPSPGQQERWICKGRLWRLRWSLCGAFVSLRLGGSLDGLRGRWYEGTGEGGRLRCRLWRPLKGCRHLSGDGLLQRRGCISWIHCNLHPYLWIMFHKPGVAVAPRFFVVVPYAHHPSQSLSWFFSQKGRNTKFRIWCQRNFAPRTVQRCRLAYYVAAGHRGSGLQSQCLTPRVHTRHE